MTIYKWKDDYFYGAKYGDIITIYTDIENKGMKYNMEKNEVKKKTPRDPEGNPMVYYSKEINVEEIEDWDTPRRYPGKYYWVWYNGEFFEVTGESKGYVYVKVHGIAHADALGIPREKVLSTYPEDPEVTDWWLKKSEIKMPDELGKGKYIYMEMGPYFILDVFKIVRREGNRIRVRGKKCRPWPPKYKYESIKKNIDEGTYPWDLESRVIKEIADKAEGEVWLEGNCVYYEATFDLEILKKYKGKRDEYGRIVLDYYLYGEEEVPYRL